MILNDILHDSQEFAAALALEAQSKKEGRKKEGRRPAKNATGKKKVISDDTE